MTSLLQRSCKEQNHHRQHRNAAHYTKDNALRHNQSKVHAHLIGHETQCQETGNCRNGASCHRNQRCIDGLCHGRFRLYSVIQLFHIAVPQEDGIVHGHAQLQHRRNGFGDIGDFSEHDVGSHVVQNCQSDTQQEQERCHIGVQQQHHYQKGQRYRHRYVLDFFRLRNILQIQNHGCHSSNIRVLVAHLSNLIHGIQRMLIRNSRIVECYQHRCILVIDIVLHHLRVHGNRNGWIHHVLQIYDGFHMIHLLNVLLQLRHIIRLHILQNENGEAALVELIHQQVLTLYTFHIAREV